MFPFSRLAGRVVDLFVSILYAICIYLSIVFAKIILDFMRFYVLHKFGSLFLYTFSRAFSRRFTGFYAVRRARCLQAAAGAGAPDPYPGGIWARPTPAELPSKSPSKTKSRPKNFFKEFFAKTLDKSKNA